MTRLDPMVKQQRLDEIRVRTLSGESAESIATTLGISSRTVTRWRGRLGIAQPVPPRLSEEQEQIVKLLVEDGCSIREIARTVGCSDTAISRRHPNAAWSRAQCAEWLTLMRAGKAAMAA